MADVSFDPEMSQISYGTPLGDLGATVPGEAMSPMWQGAANALQALPPAWLALGANPYRTSNTLIHGGRLDKKGIRGRGLRFGNMLEISNSKSMGTTKWDRKKKWAMGAGEGGPLGGLRRQARLAPTRFRGLFSTRLASSDMLISANADKMAMNPFQMASFGNMAMRGLTNTNPKGIGKLFSSSKVREAVESRFGPGAGANFFEQGSLGLARATTLINKQSAAGTLSREASDRVWSIVRGNLGMTSGKTSTALPAEYVKLREAVNAGRIHEGHAIGLSSRSVMGRARAGFQLYDDAVKGKANPSAAHFADDATRWGRNVAAYSQNALDAFGHGKGFVRGAPSMFKGIYRQAGKEALETGATKLAARKASMLAATKLGGAMAARFGMTAASGPAAPFVGAAMLAWTIYDITKLVVGGVRDFVVKPAVNIARDSIKSIKGSIEKPTMGMGFNDNEVAATSRARGVQAIQNSRLNARSVLGSEAASLYNHFR